MRSLHRAFLSRSQPQGGARSLETQMTKSSPHKRWKGHCMMCGAHKHKGNGDTFRTPWSVLRKTGVKRRYSRNKPYGDNEA